MKRPRTASNTEILPPLHLDRLADRDWDPELRRTGDRLGGLPAPAPHWRPVARGPR